MEENNNNIMDKLTKLVVDIDKAMEMTREKQLLINDMKEELMQETRPMMVEERKIAIKSKVKDKKEFDQMTTRALKRAKKDIETIREQSENEYQKKLLDTLEKRREIEKKLKSMEQKGLTEEKLTMARNAASKALNKVNEEMKTYQDEHFAKRAKLDEFESRINNYAIELGVDINQEKANKTRTTKNKKEESKIQEGEAKKQNSEVASEESKGKDANVKTSNVKEDKVVNNSVTGSSLRNGPVKESEENLITGQELPKVAFVEVKDNKYIFAYETKENGVYSINKKECEKLGFFKGIFEKSKLFANRKEYGMDFMSVMRADINIYNNLNDKDKEKYLNYVSGQAVGCFDINYDNPKNRKAKALVKGQERLALKAAIALEQYGPIIGDDIDLKKQIENELITPEVDEKEHIKTQNKYDKMFGQGFDQHNNPPVAPKRNKNKSKSNKKSKDNVIEEK